MHGTKHISNAVAYWSYHDDKQLTILVIHGFRGTHHGLEKLISRLPEYRFIVPDLPGFGDSPALLNTPHTVKAYAIVVSNLAQRIGLKNPILLGHSMGTLVAADIISATPGFATSLICINPIAENPPMLTLFPGFLYHRLAGKYLPERLGEKVLRNKLLFLVGSATMTKTRDKALRKEIHYNHITYMKRFSDRTMLLEAFESSNTTTLAEYVDDIRIPVLLIAGIKDAIAPIKGQRRLVKRFSNAKLVELSNVGHIVHYEQPREAAEAIRTFLS